MTNKSLKCFISASPRINTTVLRDILEKKGILVYDIYDFNIGNSIQNSLKVKIKEADFVIIIISGYSPNIFYEMGMCEGMGKPIFVIVDKNYEVPFDLKNQEVPFYLKNHMHIKTSLDNDDLLKISISKFADEIISNKQYIKKKKKLKTVKSTNFKIKLLKNYLETIDLQSLRENGTESALVKITEEIFNVVKLQYASNQLISRNEGLDLIVWDDNLNLVLGNPIIVEIKYGLLNPQKIYQSEEQLVYYINKSESKAGILLYLDKEGTRFQENFTLNHLILRFDFEDFINEISQNKFEDVILIRRNKMVHGILE